MKLDELKEKIDYAGLEIKRPNDEIVPLSCFWIVGCTSSCESGCTDTCTHGCSDGCSEGCSKFKTKK